MNRETENTFSASKVNKWIGSGQEESLCTNFMIATSLAVVKWGRPALRFKTFAIISFSLFMVITETLLNWLLEIFTICTQDSGPMVLAGKSIKH
jgi:hypothetical protein